LEKISEYAVAARDMKSNISFNFNML